MKTCPICHAVAFDDASLCFGCMYRFEDDASGEDMPEDGKPDSEPAAIGPSDACTAPAERIVQANPPAFVIKMVPVMQESGAVSWTCNVGLAET